MTLERERFQVYLQDPNGNVTVHAVTVHHADLLRGELEHNRQGNPDKGANLNLVTAWCWAALVRRGDYTQGFAQFRDMDCVGLVDDGKETVDPTQQATPGVSV